MRLAVTTHAMPVHQKTTASSLLTNPDRGSARYARRLATTIETMISSQSVRPTRPSSAPMPMCVSWG